MIVSLKHSHWLIGGTYHHAMADLWLIVANTDNQSEFEFKSKIASLRLFSDYIYPKSQIYNIPNIE
jgi:hypothetical protein